MRKGTPVRHPIIPVLALALLSGCGALEGLSKPTAKVTGAHLEGLDLQGAALLFDVEVSNPYGVPLPVAKLDYALSSGGKRFLDGASDHQGSIPASGKQTLPVRARLNFSEVLGLIGGIRPGAVIPYAADVGIAVDAPAVGRLRVPVSHQGEFPVPTIPRFRVKDVKWQELSLQKASALLRLDVANDNQFPLDLDRLVYALQLGGVKVAESSLQKQVAFEPGQTQPLDIGFSLKPSDLGLSVFNMLSGSSSAFRFDGTLSTMTPFGPLSFPVGDSGQAPLSR